MVQVYKAPKRFKRSLSAGIAAVATSLAIFLLLPLTHFIRDNLDNEKTVRKVDPIEEPPPPPPAPPVIPNEQQEEPLLLPKLEKTVPPISLDKLSVSLNTKPDGQTVNALELGQFAFAPTGVKDLVYKVAELDRYPKPVKRGSFKYPSKLQKRRIEGYVKLLISIDPTGRTKVLKIADYSHKGFIKSAKQHVESTRYEPPLKDGKPVTTTFYVKVPYRLPKD